MVVNVLLAEDMPVVREYMVDLLMRSGLPISICGVASTGLEAIKIAQTKQVDIFVTDVKMPGMDGLSAITRIRELHPACQSIVITGFSEFESARKALSLEVVDYLLKPIKESELLDGLQRAFEKLQKHREYGWLQRDQIEFDIIRRQNELAEKLRQLLLTETEKAVTLFGNDRDNGFFTVLLIRLDQLGVSSFQNEDRELVRAGLLNITEELAGPLIPHILLRSPFEGVEAFILLDDENSAALAAKTYKLAQSILQNVKTALGVSITLGQSQCVAGLAMLRSASSQANKALAMRFKGGCGRFYTYDEVIRDNESANAVFLLNFHTINRILEYGNVLRAKDMLLKYLAECFDPQNIQGVSARNIRHGFYDLLTQLWQAYPGMFDTDHTAVSLSEKDAAEFSHLHTLQDMSTYIAGICLNLLQGKKVSDDTFSPDQVRRYIDEYYMEDISLTSAADSFSVSPKYLSRIFKKQYNQNFVDYLNIRRIQQSQKLLRDTDLAIDSIASMVGFNSAMYFFKVFKKYTGKTPTEYRNST